MIRSEPCLQQRGYQETMGDDAATAIFTAFAKVYTMNPNNQSFWIPTSSCPVPVSFYFDKHRSVYRIISYDKQDLVVNSTMYPSMSFVKTSATFGLWSDTKLRTIYGLGFSSTDHLHHFADWFEKIVRTTKMLEDNLPPPPPAHSAGSMEDMIQGSKVDQSQSQSHKSSPSHLKLPAPDSGANMQGGDRPGWYVPDKPIEHCGNGDEIKRGNYKESPKSVDCLKPNQTGAQGVSYEVDRVTSLPTTELTFENLQYQREVLKVKQLEIELTSVRNTVNTMHEAIQKKCAELDKLKTEQSEDRETLQDLRKQMLTKESLIAKLQESESVLKKQLDDMKIQQIEREHILTNKRDEVRFLKEEVERGEDRRRENEILKERLRQLQTEFDLADKNWNVVEVASSDMGDMIQGLIGVQSRLKQVKPNNN